MADNEKKLVSGLKGREPWAIDLFVKSHSSYIYSVCYNILKKKMESEEATQDVCMKVLNKIDGFDILTSFKTWIFTIAYRTAIDYYRKKKNHGNEDALLNHSATETTDQAILNNEQNNSIEKLLQHLNEEDSRLVRLYYLNEMNIKELVEVTGLSESNIKIKLFRARKELAKHAGRYFEID